MKVSGRSGCLGDIRPESDEIPGDSEEMLAIIIMQPCLTLISDVVSMKWAGW